jgi:acyl-CoA thioesterase FadM
LPNDIDINRHMNNGRYLTMVDLMIVEFFARSGFLKVLLRNKWYPVIGGTCITYRRELGFAQRYTLRFQRVASDTHWNYLKFEFIDEAGKICATGYSKGAAKSRTGLVPNAKSYAAMGLAPDFAPLPDAVAHWIESESALIS